MTHDTISTNHSQSHRTCVFGGLLKTVLFSRSIDVYRAFEALVTMHYTDLCFTLHHGTLSCVV